MSQLPKNKISLSDLSIMNREIIRELARQQHIQRLACYRLTDKQATLILDTSEDESNPWPAIFNCNEYYYTLKGNPQLTFGWQTTPVKIVTNNPTLKNIKSYLPPQDPWATKLLFLVKKDGRSTGELGELDGFLEALGRRFHFWIANDELRHFIDETTSHEQIHSFGAMLSRLISHEIRNPITNLLSIAQSQVLLSETEESKLFASEVEKYAQQIWDVIVKLEVIATDGDKNIAPTAVPQPIDFRSLVEAECAREEQLQDATMKSKVLLHIAHDSYQILGVASLVKLSIREVIHNAFSYANGTPIKISLYSGGNSIILDIQDEGVPISPGQEELMFLRYYQGPKAVNSRSSMRRGLGLGLHLARSVTNFHNGQLLFVRGLGKKGAFRFIWPKHESNLKAS